MNVRRAGATLHHEVRGHGPVLLILQGGDGDAQGSDFIAERLESRFTVLTYDRRGLSRSKIDEGGELPDTLAVHTEDASAVLAAVTQEPAFVAGISIGGAIGLDLLARHSQQVRRLVSFEPPVTQLMPEAERDVAVATQLEIEALYKAKGAGFAMRRFFEIAGVKLDDIEPGVTLPAPNPGRLRNIEFFLAHDTSAVRGFTPDVEALKAQRAKLVLGGGSAAREALPFRCAAALAKAVGLELVEFKGAHNAHTAQPTAFAEKLASLLLP
jgi:pimeloyl-ACP methyl ester carboxylesterase